MKRQEEDRHHLLANLSNSHVVFLPDDALQPNLTASSKENMLSTLKNSNGEPRLDFAAHQDCDYVDLVQFKTNKYLGIRFMTVTDRLCLGVNVAVPQLGIDLVHRMKFSRKKGIYLEGSPQLITCCLSCPFERKSNICDDATSIYIVHCIGYYRGMNRLYSWSLYKATFTT